MSLNFFLNIHKTKRIILSKSQIVINIYLSKYIFYTISMENFKFPSKEMVFII